MTTHDEEPNTLEDVQMNVRQKLAALWTSFMFLYIYVDYFALYMPGKLQGIQQGTVFVFDITQGFILTTLTAVSIPALMIFVSVALTAKINRCANIIVAVVYIPFTLFNLTGVTWMHMVFAASVEVALLCFILRLAWRWPRTQTFNTTG